LFFTDADISCFTEDISLVTPVAVSNVDHVKIKVESLTKNYWEKWSWGNISMEGAGGEKLQKYVSAGRNAPSWWEGTLQRLENPVSPDSGSTLSCPIPHFYRHRSISEDEKRLIRCIDFP
jgi:hypothetical protein